jgi:hypothetical protein
MQAPIRGLTSLLAAATVALAVAPAPGGAAAQAPGGAATAPGGAAAAAAGGAPIKTPARPAPSVLTVGGPTPAQAIAPGFVGLSLETWAVPAYAGPNPAATNPVFVQLIRNLADGAPPVLRIGGVTTDNSWWPAHGLSRPAGATYPLTRRWVAITRGLANALGARLILGINLEADSTAIARAEGNALVSGIGRDRVEALEPGNEPELYGSFKWGLSGAPGRPAGYNFADFERDFTRIAAALPNVPLAGPTDGAPSWFRLLGPFLSTQPRVKVATLHRYPLQQCFVTPDQPNYPTIPNLLAPSSSTAMADTVTAAVKAAHAHHVSVRIDEMNTISCGNMPAVGESFASALWALDTLFAMAQVGVDGVNIHTFPDVGTQLFTFRRVHGQWRGKVEPEYYGLDMFARAAPPGSRLLTVSPAGPAGLHAWATRALDGTVRVVLINEGTRAGTVAVRLRPGATTGGASTAAGTGTLERLQAPSTAATSGVTLGGQGFGAATGLLAGRAQVSTVAARHTEYTVTVPAGSAAMLTLAPSR